MRKLFKYIANHILLFLLIIIFFAGNIFISREKNVLQIYTLDVGQGDSILIKTKENQYILIDGGPDEKALQELQQIIPFFKRRLDLVILIHPDQDHVGGLPDILNYYDVGAVSYSPIRSKNLAYKNFQEIVKKKQIRNLELDEDGDFDYGCCVHFDVLWPEKGIDYAGYSGDTNSISTAIVVRSGNYKIYLGGDLPAEQEEQVFEKNHYDLDAIKVSHHGSKSATSEEFLDLTTPETAIISVGIDNTFGHPSQVVLQRLNERGIKIYRTDELGRIEISP